MKSFLLLILSLITGCEASSEVQGCLKGWFEFNCTNSDPKEQIIVHMPKQKPITNNPGDTCEKDKNFCLYRDKLNKILTVVVNKLEKRDFGDYWCKIGKSSPKIELEDEKRGCQTKLFQTVWATATTNFTCDRIKTSRVTFLCKKDGFKCTEMIWTLSTTVSNGKFTLTVSPHVFTIEIRHVSAQDAGVYWCGLRSQRAGRYHRTALKEIQLEVQESPPSTTPSIHPRTPSSTPYSTSSSQSTTASVERKDISWLIGVIAAVTCVAATGLLVFICRRAEGLKNTANEGAKNEDHCYAEIQELPQKSDSGTTPKTVYATTIFSLTPYSVVQLPNSSGDMWSTVTGDEQAHTYSTVNEPPKLTDTALCYTLNKPQQQ
ncbi:uncharacterized protein LOC131461171 [Solea solea]|uniref:uncharacterized protein LOC131461171 n=1 Tax=Solea solea TaxID=90069 RepID=UPI002729E6EC|nr:uncharacterized protein LOC131461171 [Solea solea]